MTDKMTEPTPVANRTHLKRTVVRDAPPKQSDPLVQILWAIFALMLLGGLLTAVMALLNGSINTNGIPTTRTARQVVELKEELGAAADEDKPAVWHRYIVALAVDGRTRQANREFDKFKKAAQSPDFKMDRAAYLPFIEGIFAQDAGQTDQAITYFEQSRKDTYALYEEELKNGGSDGNWAKAQGPDEVYSKSLAALLNLYEEKKDWQAMLATADAYIEVNPRDADAFERRGDIKLQLKDEAGARKDFEQALKFIPDNIKAQKKLDSIDQAAPKRGEESGEAK